MNLKSFHEELITNLDENAFRLERPTMNESFISLPLNNNYSFMHFQFDYESETDISASIIFIKDWNWKNTIVTKALLKKDQNKHDVKQNIEIYSDVIIYYSNEFIVKNIRMLEYFTHVMSLGTWCMASQYLKYAGIKEQSYPFDWVLSTIDIISDCIETNFEQFLDKTHMEYKCISQYPQVDHTFYNINMFLHHDPLNNDKDFRYFKRCVERFVSLYNEKSYNVLFFSMFHVRPSRRELGRIHRYLKSRVINFKIVIVYNKQTAESVHCAEEYDYFDSENVRIFQLYSDKFIDDNWHGMKTYSTIDQIFDNFRFNQKN